jgi:catechol 2,3-dioxygenase-like lactoylglutathione lyase family enzyme
MPGSAKRLFPMLSVEHLDHSLKFYGQLLGGQQSYRFPSEGEPAFVTLMFGPTEIGLGQIGGGPALHGQPLRPATGHRIELCVYVDHLDGKVAELRAAHVPIVLEPTLQPWGERVAYVSDPDGNLVMLVQ